MSHTLPCSLTLAATLLFAATMPANAQEIPGPDPEEALMRSIPVTRWADPTTRPETRDEFLRKMRRSGRLTDAPFTTQRAYRSPVPIDAGGRRFDVLLNANLQSGLQAKLNEYINDLEIEGWAVTLWLCSGGTPPELRAFLQTQYTQRQIVGCLLIGDLPVAWYRNETDFSNRPAEFPTDLFYMDLDGIFEDTNKDNKYDRHYGKVAGDERPDIFVGRLTASPLITWGSEVDLLRNYFYKVHLYRTGKLTAPARALAFQDDDWYTMGTYQERAFPAVTKISDKNTTTGPNYKLELQKGFASVIVCSHSSPTVHTFKSSSGTTRVYNSEMWNLDPPCLFYNLFACSNARYTSAKYYGGVYVFLKTKSLIALGTTKTGSMLQFSDYYTSLGQQKCFGEAFRYWFGRRYPYSNSDVCWFYGMTLLGDPTLRISRPLLTPSVATLPTSGGKVRLSLDGRPDNANQLYLVLASMTGNNPGLAMPGLRVPINFDPTTEVFLLLAGSPAFSGAVGNLNNLGQATTTFNMTTTFPTALWGRTFTFTGLVLDRTSMAFNLCTPPTSVKIGP